MGEYLVEVPHSVEECPLGPQAEPSDALKPAGAVRLWGCRTGVHTSWLIAEVVSEEEAWLFVPRLLRDTARIVSVERL